MDEEEIQSALAQLQAWNQGMAGFAECIVWFQRIEHTLSICISVFSGMAEELGEIVVSQMSFRVRVSSLAALATHRANDNQLHDDISQLLARVREAEQERNRLVHSMWELSEDNPGMLQREKASVRKNAHSIDIEDFHPEDFEEIQRDFEGINTDLIFLFSEHYPELADQLHY